MERTGNPYSLLIYATDQCERRERHLGEKLLNIVSLPATRRRYPILHIEAIKSGQLPVTQSVSKPLPVSRPRLLPLHEIAHAFPVRLVPGSLGGGQYTREQHEIRLLRGPYQLRP